MFGRAICQRCTGVPVQHLTGRAGVPPHRRGGPSRRVRPEAGDRDARRARAVGARRRDVLRWSSTRARGRARSRSRSRTSGRTPPCSPPTCSPEAVELARANAERLGLHGLGARGRPPFPAARRSARRVDLVVSNPPYVDEAELADLPREVRADPPLALVGDLEPYRRLAAQARRMAPRRAACWRSRSTRAAEPTSPASWTRRWPTSASSPTSPAATASSWPGRRDGRADPPARSSRPRPPRSRAGSWCTRPTRSTRSRHGRTTPRATGRLFEAKTRSRDLELPVLVPSTSVAREIARLRRAGRGARPALLARAAHDRAAARGPSRPWDLGGDPRDGRRPDAQASARARRCSRARGRSRRTSANRCGEATPGTCEEIEAVFGERVDVYLCDETSRTGLASTVVDLAHGEPRVLRPGSVTEGDILAALGPGPGEGGCRLAPPWQRCSSCAPATCAGRRSPRGCSERRSSNASATRRPTWRPRARWGGRVAAPTRARSPRPPSGAWTSPAHVARGPHRPTSVGATSCSRWLGARDAVVAGRPRSRRRTFTLKELVRLLEALPAAPGEDLRSPRVAAADALRRRGFRGQPARPRRRGPARACRSQSLPRGRLGAGRVVRAPGGRACSGWPPPGAADAEGGVTCGSRSACDHAGYPLKEDAEGVPGRAGPRGARPRHRLGGAGRLPGLLRRRRPRGRGRAGRAGDRARRLGAGRADRGEQGPRRPGGALQRPAPSPSSRAGTTTRTCSRWAGASWPTSSRRRS